VGHSDRVGNGVGNKRGSVDSVGKNRGGVHSVGNNGGSVDSVGNRSSHRVRSLTGVGDLSNIAINVVGVVGDSLDTSVRKVDRVGALNNTCAIVALGLAEGSLGIVVGNPIVVGVGGHLSQIANNRGSVGNSVDNRGMVDNRGSVHNRGVDSMSEGGSVGNHRGGMDQGCGMCHSMAKTVSNNAVGKTVVGNGVGESRGSVGNYWSGVGNGMVGNWVSHMGSQGNNSSVSDRDRPVGSDGRLDLREALGVVSLSD